jgi:hypothetical protein
MEQRQARQKVAAKVITRRCPKARNSLEIDLSLSAMRLRNEFARASRSDLCSREGAMKIAALSRALRGPNRIGEAGIPPEQGSIRARCRRNPPILRQIAR